MAAAACYTAAADCYTAACMVAAACMEQVSMELAMAG
jgi:hypothetical protein